MCNIIRSWELISALPKHYTLKHLHVDCWQTCVPCRIVNELKNKGIGSFSYETSSKQINRSMKMNNNRTSGQKPQSQNFQHENMVEIRI